MPHPRWRQKMPRAPTKTWCNQTNKNKHHKIEKSRCLRERRLELFPDARTILASIPWFIEGRGHISEFFHRSFWLHCPQSFINIEITSLFPFLFPVFTPPFHPCFSSRMIHSVPSGYYSFNHSPEERTRPPCEENTHTHTHTHTHTYSTHSC